MKTALPFLLLSGVSLILWVWPGGRALFTAAEIGSAMTIEIFVLFFCAVLSAHISNVINQAGGPGATMSRVGLVAAVLAAFAIGGAAALLASGLELALIYGLALILHVHGMLRLSYREMQVEGIVNLYALIAFVCLGLLAYKAPIPAFGDSYPVILPDFKIRLEGHRMLAWACAHFAVLGCLHLGKRRMFAHVLQADDPK
jgi:hypothetical protein